MTINTFVGTTDNDWGTSTNWSSGTVPTSTDGYITTFDATSPNCTISGSNKVANALDFTNYINTVTFITYGISVYGNITLGANMNIVTPTFLHSYTTGNLTSNGKAFMGH